MINNVVLVGRLTKEPVVTYSKSEPPIALARFTLAVSRQKRDESDFISCAAFGKMAETIGKFLKKGNLVAIQGSIRTGSFQNKEGQKIYTTDVIVSSVQFLEKRTNDSDSNGQDGFMNIPDNMEEGLPFN